MEIEINNTSTADDDYVQVQCLRPAGRKRVPCRIRVTTPPATQATTVVLTNPDGRLRFPATANTTATVTVPSDGSWAAFEITGETGSAALNDAVIEAHCNTATGATLATKTVTVFWFDNATIAVNVGGPYSVQGNRYTPAPANAVNYVANARIRPAGVNCAAPQVANLRIGILQNNLGAVHAVTWSAPAPTWNAGVAVGTRVDVPTSVRRTRSLPAGTFNDSEAQVAPLYDQPGKGSTLDPNSLQPPTGCPAAAAATSFDSPSPTMPPLVLPMQNGAGVNVGSVRYNTVSTSTVDGFIIWTVVFNTTTNEVCALRQRLWDLNVDSAAVGVQQATAAATDTAPTQDPVTAGPFGNNVINDPANQVITPTGTTTLIR